MAKQLKAIKCPSDALALSNCAIVNPREFDPSVRHVIIPGATQSFIFTIRGDGSVPLGEIGFNTSQRKWAMISVEAKLVVTPFQFDLQTQLVGSTVVEVDFMSKKNVTLEPYDTDRMANDFLQQYGNQALTVGQEFPFQMQDQSKKMLIVRIKSMTAADVRAAIEGGQAAASSKPAPLKNGQLSVNSSMVFEKAENSSLNLIGKSKGKSQHTSIINPDWDFTKMGIGGLDKEFNTIFRRAFASRVFPPEIIQQLDMKHVRGILLYGPPGTGKTLMARQIGKMLNAREPKIVDGPQILNKYVGESEANIRKLFADAEEEEKRVSVLIA